MFEYSKYYAYYIRTYEYSKVEELRWVHSGLFECKKCSTQTQWHNFCLLSTIIVVFRTRKLLLWSIWLFISHWNTGTTVQTLTVGWCRWNDYFSTYAPAATHNFHLSTAKKIVTYFHHMITWQTTACRFLKKRTSTQMSSRLYVTSADSVLEVMYRVTHTHNPLIRSDFCRKRAVQHLITGPKTKRSITTSQLWYYSPIFCLFFTR